MTLPVSHALTIFLSLNNIAQQIKVYSRMDFYLYSYLCSHHPYPVITHFPGEGIPWESSQSVPLHPPRENHLFDFYHHRLVLPTLEPASIESHSLFSVKSGSFHPTHLCDSSMLFQTCVVCPLSGLGSIPWCDPITSCSSAV